MAFHKSPPVSAVFELVIERQLSAKAVHAGLAHLILDQSGYRSRDLPLIQICKHTNKLYNFSERLKLFFKSLSSSHNARPNGRAVEFGPNFTGELHVV